MQRSVIQRIVGLLLMVFSFTTLPPAAVGLWYGDGAVYPFVAAFVVTLIMGLIAWFPVRKVKMEVRLRGGFIIVAVFWLVLGLSGSLPFMLSENPHMSLTDSVFESISALTTTGATVITGIDELPHSILFLSTAITVDGWHGQHRISRRDSAHVGHWWYAVVSCGNAGADERQ